MYTKTTDSCGMFKMKHTFIFPGRTVLTGLESEIKRSERTGRAFAILIFDLDG